MANSSIVLYLLPSAMANSSIVLSSQAIATNSSSSSTNFRHPILIKFIEIHAEALSVALAVVFVVITAGIVIVKFINGSIGMPRLLPKLVDQASFWKLFTTVPVLCYCLYLPSQ
ncbi:hypothetical protein HAX54_038303 [Datura stramonium]|uniref:Uncharacterized protein n=1 Tax=Datura stramonium TaxID=4076 RepID=A0ABS8VNJ7_DATST|nr:hypothetical protein [Datura stramonium]